MSSQRMRRLDDGNYALVDGELILVCTPATSCGNVGLIGSAFLTRSSGWRLLRRGLVDIGYSPLPELAIARLMEDAAELGKSAEKRLPTALVIAKRTIQAGGDIGHETCKDLLAFAIAQIEHLETAKVQP